MKECDLNKTSLNVGQIKINAFEEVLSHLPSKSEAIELYTKLHYELPKHSAFYVNIQPLKRLAEMYK